MVMEHRRERTAFEVGQRMQLRPTAALLGTRAVLDERLCDGHVPDDDSGHQRPQHLVGALGIAASVGTPALYRGDGGVSPTVGGNGQHGGLRTAEQAPHALLVPVLDDGGDERTARPVPRLRTGRAVPVR